MSYASRKGRGNVRWGIVQQLGLGQPLIVHTAAEHMAGHVMLSDGSVHPARHAYRCIVLIIVCIQIVFRVGQY